MNGDSDCVARLDAIERALAEIGMAADTGPCDKHRGHGSHDSHQEGDNSLLGRPFGGAASFLPREIKNRIDAGHVNAETGQCLYMLLSLILDLWRRNEYIYVALKDLVLKAKVDPTGTCAAHGEFLDSLDAKVPVPWDERAMLASAIVHRMLDETEAHHGAALKQVVGEQQALITAREEKLVAAKMH